MRFFFYGTLVDADVRRAVLGSHAPRCVERAILHGWRRAAVPGKTYPVIVADPTAIAEGVLVRGLGAASRRRLDRYEDDDLYDLIAVQVVPDGRRRPVPALVFAAKTERRSRAAAAWSFEDWERRHKRRLLLTLRRRSAA